MTKLLNIFLLLILAGGLVRIFVQASVLKDLREEHRRLTAVHGELDVKDPSKFLVTGVDTGDSQHFKWRIFVPAGVTVQERVGFKVQASGGGSTRTDAHETTLQVRFDFSQQDKLVDHVLGAGRDRMRSFDHHQDVTAFLKEHWNELDKILLGDQGPVEVPLDRPLELLTIRVPLNLHAEFEKRVGEGSVSFYNPVYQVVHGTPAAFKWLDKRNAEKTGE